MRGEFPNFTKTDFRGIRVTDKFDKELTEDSARRIFEYLDNSMKRR